MTHRAAPVLLSSLAAASLLVLLPLLAMSGCGKPEEAQIQGRTATDWVKDLFSLDPAVRGRATDELVEGAIEHEGDVMHALKTALLMPREKAEGAPISISPDLEAAKREGLETDIPATEAANMVLATVRARLHAVGAESPITIRGDGTLHALLPLKPRAEIDAIQRLLVARGSFEIRPIVRAVAKDATGTPRWRAYEGTSPFAEFVAGERKRWTDARAWKTPYKPSDPRYRLVPKASSKEEGPADFEVVLEPKTEDEAIDERIVGHASLSRDPDGRIIVVLGVRPARQEAMRRIVGENAGRALAVVVDGVAREASVLRTPRIGETIEIGLWDANQPGADDEARLLAALVSSGRMPIPFKAVPIEGDLGRDPAPDTAVARVFVAIGEKSLPTLEEIAASGDAPPEAITSAKWAIGKIKAAPPRSP